VFAFASGTKDITPTGPTAVATGMRVTFAVAATLIVVALAIAVIGRADKSQTPPQAEIPT
jgi:hypothetical protein